METIIVNAVLVAAVLGLYIAGMLYVSVRIGGIGKMEGIGNGNIIHYCYYNSNHSIGIIGISNGNVVGFWFINYNI